MAPNLSRLRAVVSLLKEPPWPTLLTLSLLGWLAMAFTSHGNDALDLCISASGALLDRGWRAFQVQISMMSVTGVALSLMIMLIAMMSLILRDPIMHIWNRSLKRRRVRSLGLFLISYCGLWAVCAPLLVAVGILLRVAAIMADMPVLLLAASLVAFWQITPWKQHFLNLCHWTPRLSAFGWAADRDCLRYGLREAWLCVGTCWALMVLPFAVHDYHLLFMAAASAIMVSERLRPGRPPRRNVPRRAVLLCQGALMGLRRTNTTAVPHFIGSISSGIRKKSA
ncbi:DUF2182 domain-containing protein [Agrobacterium vitis]|uniref:copper chaperone n=1 Tax=Agrobacterium vitis TaxID=373 RepID=UPI0012E86660|nr:DUF2182 domain-containing protein [Agrobacterium vitis]MVA23500.1 hypothetical protein [Agrobacterium vitis]